MKLRSPCPARRSSTAFAPERRRRENTAREKYAGWRAISYHPWGGFFLRWIGQGFSGPLDPANPYW